MDSAGTLTRLDRPVEFIAADRRSVDVIGDLGFFRTRQTIEIPGRYPIHHRTVRRSNKDFRVYTRVERHRVNATDSGFNTVDTRAPTERQRR